MAEAAPLAHQRLLAAGPLLLLVSAVAFSTAGFFARTIPVDAATMLFWRNLLGALILFPLALRELRNLTPSAVPRALAITGLSAFGSVCYINAFSFTAVANVSIIYAAAPMVTAALAWAVLRERMSARTLAAVLVAFTGVALTAFGGGVGHVTLLGDGLAFAMTLALSAVAVLSRGQFLPPLVLSCASSLLAGVAILPARPDLSPTLPQLIWLAVFGAVTMAVALPCYLMGLRTVPAGRAMLISAFELPLAPFWVWAAYGEVPSAHAMIGGATVAAAILWDLSARSS